jgi:hypothetical protein
LAIRLVAIVSTIVTAALLDMIVLQNLQGDHFILRLTIATAIVASTSTIATAFIIQRNWKHFRRGEENRGVCLADVGKPGEYETLRVECPRCLQLSAVPFGDSTCPRCGLMLRIEVFAGTQTV